MKKILTSLFFLGMFCSTQAQWAQINSISWIPSNPTTVDTVKLITDCTLGQSSCPLLNYLVNYSFPIAYVNAYYCQGMLTVLCNTVDTFDLGVLQAGANDVMFTLWSDFPGSGCVTFNPIDSGDVQIIVSSPTGIPDDEIIPVRIVSIDDGFVIKGAERMQGSKDFVLYSIASRMVYHKILTEGENKINPVLVPGIYFYRLHAGNDFHYGKMFSD